MIRRTIRSKNITAHFHWVPGHAGIRENDIVDELAKKGASFSSMLTRTINLKEIARASGFSELELGNNNAHL